MYEYMNSLNNDGHKVSDNTPGIVSQLVNIKNTGRHIWIDLNDLMTARSL
jgi:pectate lyase